MTRSVAPCVILWFMCTNISSSSYVEVYCFIALYEVYCFSGNPIALKSAKTSRLLDSLYIALYRFFVCRFLVNYELPFESSDLCQLS